MTHNSSKWLYVTPGGKGRWKYDQGVEGFLVVPFELPCHDGSDGVIAWRESANRVWRHTIPVAILLGSLGLFGLCTAFAASRPADRVLVLFFGLVLLAFAALLVGVARWRVLNERHILLDKSEIAVWRPRRTPRGQAPWRPIEDAVLRVHPLHVRIGRDTWYGFGVVVEVGQERVCVAAHKHLHDIETYVQTLPEALRIRRVEDGRTIVGAGDRVLW